MWTIVLKNLLINEMFTHPEIWAFATNWYLLLDIHAPLESFKPLLTNDVDLVFPEANLKGFEGYSSWYNKVIEIFLTNSILSKLLILLIKMRILVNYM